MMPIQARPLLQDLDARWMAQRDRNCGTRVPPLPTATWIASLSQGTSDCLVMQYQDRTAQLLVESRGWERERLGGSGGPASAAMVFHSPALDTANDELIRAFWRRAYSFPEGQGPADDADGSRCSSQQSGPVWFLAGNSRGGSVSRTCEVPAGKRLVAPVLAVVVPTGDADICTETRLSVYSTLIKTSVMYVRLDGTALRKPLWPRMHLACMPRSDGKGNLLVAGWWLYLDSLPAGAHRLEFGVNAERLKVQHDVRYDLVVL
jgi:hypothetical protein